MYLHNDDYCTMLIDLSAISHAHHSVELMPVIVVSQRLEFVWLQNKSTS